MKINFFSFFLLVALCLTEGISAQQTYFAYLQTENKLPFYVKMNKKVLNSSTTGYLIIPKLTDGAYNIQVGFPKSEWPEQNFAYTVNKKDLGFIIKNFGEKGWGLFNLQSMEVLMAGSDQKKEDVNNQNIQSDSTSTPKTDSMNVVAPQSIKNDTPATATTTINPSIQKLSQIQTGQGLELTFVDKAAEQMDTVQIFIPYEQVSSNPSEGKKDSTTEAGKFLNIELANPNTQSDSVKIEKVDTIAKDTQTLSSKLNINPNCKTLADEQDFLKIRKKMAAEDNNDDMIAVARKIFKKKCYTTGQVKNLGLLFLTDEGRYQFFDAAYPYVYDRYNFYTLQNQLTDNYYINRFKAMITNQ